MTAQAAIRPQVVVALMTAGPGPSSEASEATSTGTPGGRDRDEDERDQRAGRATPSARPLRASAISSATKNAG